MSNGLGKTFIPSPGANFRQSAADFSLRAADFETQMRVKETKDATIFMLPVEYQTAYGADGKILETFVLHAAVSVSKAIAAELEQTGRRKFSTMLEANNVARIYNNDEYTRARGVSGIASMTREEIDLSPLLARNAPQPETAFVH